MELCWQIMVMIVVEVGVVHLKMTERVTLCSNLYQPRRGTPFLNRYGRLCKLGMGKSPEYVSSSHAVKILSLSTVLMLIRVFIFSAH